MKKTKEITYVGVLSALVIALTLISNYIQIGTISINLALVVIVVASIKCSKEVGFFVGLINGITILLAPSTVLFYELSIVGTIIICLLKSSIAGYLAGLLYEKINNKKIGIVIASILVPITNTFLFIIGSMLFYKGAFGTLITIFVTANFLIELVFTVIVSSSVSLFLLNNAQGR